jgi:hypothetical protein
VILIGQQAFEEFCSVLRQAKNFCYVISPWIGPSIAKKISELLTIENCIIIVRDYWQGNKRSYRYLKRFDFRIDPELHSKIMITDNRGVEGSSNFSHKAFFRNDDHMTFFENDEENYQALMGIAMRWISNSKPFDPKQPARYWNNKSRPLKSMPEELTDESESTDENIDENDLDFDPPEEETHETSDSEASKNIAEAWRALRGKRKRYVA